MSAAESLWRQLASEVGGQFREATAFTPFAVQARTDDWIITLDSSSHSNEGVTTLRAPFFNPEGFRFTIYRAGIFSDVRKALNMQDIDVGHRRFDRDFVIKGSSVGRVRRLFDNGKIRRLIDAQPKIHLSVQGREGVLSPFPAGVDELYFQRFGSIKDLAQLRKLFDLFAEILQQICHLGAQNPTGRAVSAAIRRLEARASLPRAAAPTDAAADTLPRAVRELGRPNSRTPPRGSRGPAERIQ